MRGLGGPVGNLRGWPRNDGSHHEASLLWQLLRLCRYPPSVAFMALTMALNLLILWGFAETSPERLVNSQWLRPAMALGVAAHLMLRT